jgi:hypothetical protein
MPLCPRDQPPGPTARPKHCPPDSRSQAAQPGPAKPCLPAYAASHPDRTAYLQSPSQTAQFNPDAHPADPAARIARTPILPYNDASQLSAIHLQQAPDHHGHRRLRQLRPARPACRRIRLPGACAALTGRPGSDVNVLPALQPGGTAPLLLARRRRFPQAAPGERAQRPAADAAPVWRTALCRRLCGGGGGMLCAQPGRRRPFQPRAAHLSAPQRCTRTGDHAMGISLCPVTVAGLCRPVQQHAHCALPGAWQSGAAIDRHAAPAHPGRGQQPAGCAPAGCGGGVSPAGESAGRPGAAQPGASGTIGGADGGGIAGASARPAGGRRAHFALHGAWRLRRGSAGRRPLLRERRRRRPPADGGKPGDPAQGSPPAAPGLPQRLRGRPGRTG